MSQATDYPLYATVIPASHELRLLKDLFEKYDKETRPAQSVEDIISVQLKLTLTNLISLNEKEEMLTTNVWLEITWNDYRLAWNSSAYDNIGVIRVPFYMVWLPEIVLENNIDGKFDVAYYANVLVYDSGDMYWLPPAIFRSTCSIEVTFFPFDWQNCSLVFRSQTYSAKEIDLQLALDPDNDQTIEWVEIDPAAFTAGGQKCTLSISVLLGQTVFLFLIAQKVPETSFSVPLIGKYLIFVMSVSTLVVLNCVVVLNISLRTPNSHSMSRKIKHVFLEVLPGYLGMHLQPSDDPWDTPQPRRRRSFGIILKAEEYVMKKPRSELMFEWFKDRHGLKRAFLDTYVDDTDMEITTTLYKNLAICAPAIKECVDACNFITESTKEQNNVDAEMLNWKLMGKVIDKICFWAALLLFTTGTLVIFLNGHFNKVPENPFPGENK